MSGFFWNSTPHVICDCNCYPCSLPIECYYPHIFGWICIILGVCAVVYLLFREEE